MDSPCYDKATKTDCPRRCKGCAIDCPEWAAYEVERNKVYEQRAKGDRSVLTNAHKQRINEVIKQKARGFWR